MHLSAALYGSREFADAIELTLWRWGYYLDCPYGPSVIIGVLIRGKYSGSERDQKTLTLQVLRLGPGAKGC